jgi:predicted lipoprotein with Yx(FWY)xxD motif
MNAKWYVLTSVAAALAIAGCGSSSKTTATGSGASAATPTQVTRSSSTPAPGLTLKHSEFGRVIFTSDRRVLYVFGADHGSTSSCYGECARAWPPLLTTSTATVGAGLNAGLLGTTRRTDGSTQVTYGGHPLYFYSGDEPGKIMCQAANMHGGFWYVVNADGSPNKTKGHAMMMGHGTKTSSGAM